MEAPAIAESPDGDDAGGPEMRDEERQSEEPAADPDAAAADVGDGGDGDVPGDEPDVVEADLTDDDLGDGASSDLFTGTEDSESSSESSESSSDDAGDEPGDDAGDPFEGLGERGESLESVINEGASRLATAGIEDDEERDDLEGEFEHIFEGFQLGYFGARFANEYVFVDDDSEVNPAWGLLGSVLVCAAFVVWMRPDGDDLVERAKDAVSGIIGGDVA